MGWSNQHFQEHEVGHEFPLGKQNNLSHAPVLPVRHPETDAIISGHHVASGNPIINEPVFDYPDTNRRIATHV